MMGDGWEGGRHAHTNPLAHALASRDYPHLHLTTHSQLSSLTRTPTLICSLIRLPFIVYIYPSIHPSSSFVYIAPLVFNHQSSNMSGTERDNHVYLAKLAEQAERYDGK
jgi:hypothetical protein